MKKCLAIVIILMLLVLVGCGKSKEVSATEEAINNIGMVGLDSMTLIAHAEMLYNDLSPEEKKQVANINTLLEAKNEYEIINRPRMKETIDTYFSKICSAEESVLKRWEDSSLRRYDERDIWEACVRHAFNPTIQGEAIKPLTDINYELADFLSIEGDLYVAEAYLNYYMIYSCDYNETGEEAKFLTTYIEEIKKFNEEISKFESNPEYTLDEYCKLYVEFNEKLEEYHNKLEEIKNKYS